MNKKQARLDPGLIALLNRTALLGTTVAQVIEDYNTTYEYKRHLSQAEMRKWVYRRVRYMEHIGLLSKTGRNEQPALYTLTNAFIQMFPTSHATNKPVGEATETKMDQLRSRLHQYQVEMLGHTSECEEYRNLIGEYPHLRVSIEKMHQEAKDKSARLIGQIRAINNIIEQTSAA